MQVFLGNSGCRYRSAVSGSPECSSVSEKCANVWQVPHGASVVRSGGGRSQSQRMVAKEVGNGTS